MGAKWNWWSGFYRVLAEANVDWHYPSFPISTGVWSVFISTHEERCSGNLDLCFWWLKQTDDSQTDRLIERESKGLTISKSSLLSGSSFQTASLEQMPRLNIFGIEEEERINLVNLAWCFLSREKLWSKAKRTGTTKSSCVNARGIPPAA